MKRHAPKLAFCVFLAAIISLVIAWTCALWSDAGTIVEAGIDQTWRRDIVTGADSRWLEGHGIGFNPDCVFHGSVGLERRAFSAGFGPWYTRASGGADPAPDAVQTLAGWPLACMRADQFINRKGSTHYDYSGALPVRVATPKG